MSTDMLATVARAAMSMLGEAGAVELHDFADARRAAVVAEEAEDEVFARDEGLELALDPDPPDLRHVDVVREARPSPWPR